VWEIENGPVDEVIAAADEHGIAMVFTSERHFRH
jgi:AICAR transformylase/IMP cyclohydrolase PurH